jgi:hypothetical protein
MVGPLATGFGILSVALIGKTARRAPVGERQRAAQKLFGLIDPALHPLASRELRVRDKSKG